MAAIMTGGTKFGLATIATAPGRADEPTARMAKWV